MVKLIMTRGLPGSGKSTRSKKMVEDNPGQYKRVNKDDLRSMLDNGVFNRKNEKFVLKMRDTIIFDTLLSDMNIIVDDTNFFPGHEKHLREIADRLGAEFWVEYFDTDVEECIRRDALREKPVGKDVIMDMYRKYMKKDEGFKYRPYVPEKIDCIIVDIDGTLAQKGDRNIYDGSKVNLDTVIMPTLTVVRAVSDWLMCQVILVSGRSDEYRDVTKERLKDTGIFYDKLLMRGKGDSRCDSIVKKELFDTHIDPEYNVLFAIDDRVKVVDMRRSLGIFTFDVNQTREVF